MRISSKPAQRIDHLKRQINTRFVKFGRRVEIANSTPQRGLLRPLLKLGKAISNWAVRHLHPLDKAFISGTVKLTPEVQEALENKLRDPCRGLSMNQNNIANQFLEDLPRQKLRMHVETESGTCVQFFDSEYLKNQIGDVSSCSKGRNELKKAEVQR